MSVGSRIRQARDEAGMSQTQLAAAIGLKSQAAVSKWESGAVVPDMPNLTLIGNALGKDAFWFLEDQGETKRHSDPVAVMIEESIENWGSLLGKQQLTQAFLVASCLHQVFFNYAAARGAEHGHTWALEQIRNGTSVLTKNELTRFYEALTSPSVAPVIQQEMRQLVESKMTRNLVMEAASGVDERLEALESRLARMESLLERLVSGGQK